MSRPFLRFLVAGLVPSLVVLVAALWLSERLERSLVQEADLRTAGTAARILAPLDPVGDGAALGRELASLHATTGRRVALYRNGVRSRASAGDTPVPDTLPAPAAGGTAPYVPGVGAVVPLGDDGGRVLVRGRSTLAPLASPRVVTVVGLAYLFLTVAGWMLLTGPGATTRAILLALVPVALSTVLVAWLAAAGDDRARALTVRALSEAMALGGRAGVLDRPDALLSLTAYPAARITPDGVRTAPELERLGQALATLRPPPPGFTSSGTLRPPGEPTLLYLLRRERSGEMTVLMTPSSEGRVQLFRLTLVGLVVLLASWTLLAGLVRRRAERPRDKGSGRAGEPAAFVS